MCVYVCVVIKIYNIFLEKIIAFIKRGWKMEKYFMFFVVLYCMLDCGRDEVMCLAIGWVAFFLWKGDKSNKIKV